MTLILEVWTYRIVGGSCSSKCVIHSKDQFKNTQTHTHTHLIDENLEASSSLYILGMVIIRWISTLTKHCMGQPSQVLNNVRSSDSAG